MPEHAPPQQPEPETSALARVRLEMPRPLAPGRLIRRYKRFLADVELDDGRVVTAHCPNSGSMLSCSEPGSPVMLSHHPDPARRTAYTWEMIFTGGGWVGVNTMLPNRLVEMAARARAVPLFAGAKAVRREVRLGAHSRLDLLVERTRGPLWVEVKNVSLVRDREARFPDAVTARGAKHLGELMGRVAAGEEAAMVYLVQRSDAECFGPAADIDPVYAEAYRRARAAGVVMLALEAQVTPEAVSLRRMLPLLL